MSRGLANLGGEEPGDRLPSVAQHAGALFSLLFEATPDAGLSWPKALDPPAETAAWEWLRDHDLHAWLNTANAAKQAQALDRTLGGAPLAVIERVHDKAFALRFAREHGYEARSLRELGDVFDPADLADANAAQQIHEKIAGWPSWTQQCFTLKPRWGSSGRGRFGGDATTAPEAIARALPRLAERGGALLEPWLERTSDVSAQLYVAPDGTITLLGTLELWVSDSGVYRGHRARLDHRHRVASGHAEDANLLEAAIAVAGAAHAEGFHGPCGVDAFTFRGAAGEELRPICEFNARFTLGTVVLGILRRAQGRIRSALGPEPSQALTFDFVLDTTGAVNAAEGELLLPLAPGAGPHCASLRVRAAGG